MSTLILAVLVGCLTFCVGVFVGYFSYKIQQLHKRVEQIATVLSQAGPGIAAQIQQGSTKVVINDSDWDQEVSNEAIVTR